VEPVEITFQEGDKALTIKVNLPPAQLWGVSGYWQQVENAIQSAAGLIYPSSTITYKGVPSPPNGVGDYDDTTD
jgi:hypothetical protein